VQCAQNAFIATQGLQQVVCCHLGKHVTVFMLSRSKASCKTAVKALAHLPSAPGSVDLAWLRAALECTEGDSTSAHGLIKAVGKISKELAQMQQVSRRCRLMHGGSPCVLLHSWNCAECSRSYDI
jgi:hypothetical protein